jgi:hypothetical protein
MLRNLLVVVLLCVGIAAFLGVIAYGFAPFKLAARPALPPARRRLWAVGTCATLFGALAALAIATAPPTSPAPTSGPSGPSSPLAPSGTPQPSDLKITSPGHLIPGQPDAPAPCSLTVRGTGAPPAGQRLAVGAQQVAGVKNAGDQEVDFESDVQQYRAGTTWNWSASITLGGADTVGYRFRVSLIEVPAAWESYIVRTRNWDKPQDTWWPSDGPPPGARELDSVIVDQADARCDLPVALGPAGSEPTPVLAHQRLSPHMHGACAGLTRRRPARLSANAGRREPRRAGGCREQGAAVALPYGLNAPGDWCGMSVTTLDGRKHGISRGGVGRGRC